MSRDADQSRAGGLEPPVQLECEEQGGELGLGVGAPARVVAFALQIVEAHMASLVVVAAHGHDASVRPLFKEGQQEARQGEMAEMIGPELELKAIGRLSV